MKVPVFVQFPPTFKSPFDVVESANVPAFETEPATVVAALLLLILNAPLPVVVKPPPIVNTAFNTPVVKVHPVLTERLPAIARAVPASAFTTVSVPVFTVTLFG